MQTKTFILFFLTWTLVSNAQEIESKADEFFYSYSFKQAANAYEKDIANGEVLSSRQYLNLADAYFQLKDYKNSSKIYRDLDANDSIISNYHFNRMLQSISKTSEMDQVKSILGTKKGSVSNELIENARFNFEFLESDASKKQNFNIFNLSINSAQSDLSPTFYKDKLLFSSSRSSKNKKVYEPTGEAYFDIFVGQVGNDGNVTKADIFERMPESKFHKTTPYYSQESGKIFYILSNTEDGQLSVDENNKNALAIGLVFENGFFAFLLRDLSTSFYYPFFDEKSKRLYFAANFEEGYGGTDIYYVSTNNGQIMSEPINLGPRINSPGNEISPYIQGTNFYFSSDTFYGLGGMDIYKSNMRQDGSFSIPINLGSGINTELDEFGFIINEDAIGGNKGYFASNRKGGKGKDDIYGFRISGALGTQTIAIKGEVVEPKYQQGISGAVVKVLDASNKILSEMQTKGDGKFQFEISSKESVRLQINKNGLSSYSKTYSGEELANLQNSPLVVQMMSLADVVEEKEGKTVVDLNDFFFAKGKSEITSDIALELDKVVTAIQKFPELRLHIETHTDSRGSTKTNKQVSQQRADAIRSYLMQNGVSNSNILSSMGYGEERIINNCTNGVYCLDFLHKKNDRTLFVIQNYEQLK